MLEQEMRKRIYKKLEAMEEASIMKLLLCVNI
jgi:hypothetical protein